MLRDGGGRAEALSATSPDRGSGRGADSVDVPAVTPAAASVSARVVVAACAAALVTALFVVGPADGSGRAWSAYLAPAGTCRGENDTQASLPAQARAIDCLVNWARAQDKRGRLKPRPALRKAAALKGRIVASCGQFSHTPCGTGMSAAVAETGYRFVLFGENLFAGPWGRVRPREVVSAWLRSPPHRENLLGYRFRDFGVAPARAHGLLGPGDAVVWTAAFATPS